jgi:hypothetical protein
MTKLPDPTRDEIEDLIFSYFPNEAVDELDRESAIYWFANHYHSGHGSNLYSILSTSDYHPSPLEYEPKGVGALIYQTLVEEFG